MQIYGINVNPASGDKKIPPSLTGFFIDVNKRLLLSCCNQQIQHLDG